MDTSYTGPQKRTQRCGRKNSPGQDDKKFFPGWVQVTGAAFGSKRPVPIQGGAMSSPAAMAAAGISAKSRAPRVRLRAHFLLSRKDDCRAISRDDNFAPSVAQLHNHHVASQHPRMVAAVPFETFDDKWSLVDLAPGALPANVTLTSPRFTPSDPHCKVKWKEAVAATWMYFNQHFEIRSFSPPASSCPPTSSFPPISSFPPASSCPPASSVEICLQPPLSLCESKRMAQAVIWFEPCLVEWLPHHQISPIYTSALTSESEKARQAAHIAVESAASCSELNALWSNLRMSFFGLVLQTPSSRRGGESYLTVDVPLSDRAADVPHWTEFALSFVEAALACTSVAQLKQFSPTKDGYRRFILARGARTQIRYDEKSVVTTLFSKGQWDRGLVRGEGGGGEEREEADGWVCVAPRSCTPSPPRRKQQQQQDHRSKRS